MNNLYEKRFYENRHKNTLYSAKEILALISEIMPPIKSAVDYGCGVGTWLSVLYESGVEEILGLDGAWVDRNLLEIPSWSFREVNFESLSQLGKKYDLAISLEVAEHISFEKADDFIENLTGSSNYILFSAAVPNQGGRGHINEQWPDYWIEKFKRKNFVLLDFIRPKIWDDRQIARWYRQNILFFVHVDKLSNVKLSLENGQKFPLSVVHPEIFLAKIQSMSSITVSGKLFIKAVFARLKKCLGNNPKI